MERAQVIVPRGNRNLMVQHRLERVEWWALPVAGVADAEEPADAALRELQEECQVSGMLVRQLSEYQIDTDRAVYTFLVDVGDQRPRLSSDPEFPADGQLITAIKWMQLTRLSERDRAFVLAAGLLGIHVFMDEVLSWSDEPSDLELKC